MCLKKEECRKIYLTRRKSLLPVQRKIKSREICQKILGLKVWQKAKVVMLYVAYKGEVDPTALILEALRGNKKLLLPKVEKKEIIPYLITSFPKDISPGYASILEPISNQCKIWTRSIDIVIVPGYAFDFQGGRLGYGLGCYDRFLKRINPSALKIGLNYDDCLASWLPIEKHDETLDIIVTENRILKIPNIA